MRDRQRSRRPEGGHPGGQARAPGLRRRADGAGRRRRRPHRHHPVEGAARGDHARHRRQGPPVRARRGPHRPSDHRRIAQFVPAHHRHRDGDRARAVAAQRRRRDPPSRPASVPFDDTCVFTSDDLLRLPCLPETLIVCGGGVIGTEFASMFARLGVRVTLVERGPRVLGFLDLQIGEALQYHLRSRGLTLRLGEEVTGVRRVTGAEADTAGVEVSLRSGKLLRAQAVLWCLGRHGATARLNLPAVGLETDERDRLQVDEHYRTANADIYAVGDVIGFPALASTSMNQGRTAVCHMFGVETQDRSRDFPIGIYSIPEISTVGRSEEQLTEQGVPYETGSARYTETARGQLLGDDVGLLKIIFHPQSHAVLGVHIIGTGATELIHIGQAVLSLSGTVDYFVESA
ncbi:hypothetical protein FJ250_05135, partial [bacterium]|nr:hypothetical protein [bacterium]